MRTFYVHSGDMAEHVDAETHEEAVVKALQLRNWTGLGMIVFVLREGDPQDEGCFIGTEPALSKAGFERIPKSSARRPACPSTEQTP